MFENLRSIFREVKVKEFDIVKYININRLTVTVPAGVNDVKLENCTLCIYAKIMNCLDICYNLSQLKIVSKNRNVSIIRTISTFPEFCKRRKLPMCSTHFVYLSFMTLAWFTIVGNFSTIINSSQLSPLNCQLMWKITTSSADVTH